jgi:hypothetical protein
MRPDRRTRLSPATQRQDPARTEAKPMRGSAAPADFEQTWGNQAALAAAAPVSEEPGEDLHDEVGLDLDPDKKEDEENPSPGGVSEGPIGVSFGSLAQPNTRAVAPQPSSGSAHRGSARAERAASDPRAPATTSRLDKPRDTRDSVPAPSSGKAPSDAPKSETRSTAAQRADAVPTGHASRSEARAEGPSSASPAARGEAGNAARARHAANGARTEAAPTDRARSDPQAPAAQAGTAARASDVSRPDVARPPAPDRSPRTAPDPSPAPDRTEAARSPHGDVDRGPTARQADLGRSDDVPGHIVDNSADSVDRGQLRKTEFLDSLEVEVTDAANQALKATLWSAEGCPWIAYWFAYYRARDSADIERAIRRFAPDARAARTASEYIPFVTQRVLRAVQVWARTGETTGLPDGLPASVTAAARAATERRRPPGSPIQFKARSGGAEPVGEARQMVEQLGSGRSLEPSTRVRMEPLLGRDLSGVRIHADPGAAALAERMNAHAFTVGEHVAFAHGEYRPGTPVGDALLAHELAHVAQQEGATEETAQGGGESVQALEEDADRSARSVVQGLWSRGKNFVKGVAENARPRLRSGLGLRACGNSRFPTYSTIVGDAAVQRETDAAWTSTKAATNAAGRREEGFWIQLDMSSSSYRFVNRFTGPTVGPGVGASATPGSKPADTGTPEKGTFTVGLFHTHTPTTFRPVGRGVGPSGADESFHSSNDVVGVVYDYEASPAGSGNIPAGHPLHSAARRYSSGPNRRSG